MKNIEQSKISSNRYFRVIYSRIRYFPGIDDLQESSFSRNRCFCKLFFVELMFPTNPFFSRNRCCREIIVFEESTQTLLNLVRKTDPKFSEKYIWQCPSWNKYNWWKWRSLQWRYRRRWWLRLWRRYRKYVTIVSIRSKTSTNYSCWRWKLYNPSSIIRSNEISFTKSRSRTGTGSKTKPARRLSGDMWLREQSGVGRLFPCQ